ncbi:GNAT family N-acetyltransferase [Leifsonia shinshuensis]|uniref:GNAT family N-acetyltransferase n=1 Tax=Leifsonia TaxID=110932 RepID=UPI0028679FC2|nr:GNAT family N-acetyltransferase [Leifsonia shinshuensis]MDR6972598.1 putative GNAT family acetyltransferase [Leifsonia shinshuensis]
MTTEFSDQTDESRYAMHVDGELAAVLDYRILGDAISLTRAYTAPNQRGKGYAGQLVEWAVDDIEKNGTLHIVPMCSYVGDWFDKHPERAALLQRRAG